MVLPDGPAAIRTVSDDRMVWTLDGGAKGAGDLAPGKVLFASSDAVGRVLRLDRRGGDVAVTLAPVSLTEVVSDAHLTLSQPVALDALEFREVPDLPGAVVDAPADMPSAKPAVATDDSSGGAATARLPEFELIAAHRPLVRAGGETERSKKVGDWKLTAYRDSGRLGLRGERVAGGGGLKVTFDAHIEAQELRVTAACPPPSPRS